MTPQHPVGDLNPDCFRKGYEYLALAIQHFADTPMSKKDIARILLARALEVLS